MKKSLLFLLVTGVVGSMQAQNSAPARPKYITVSPLQAAQQRQRERLATEKQSASKPSANQTKKSHNVASNTPALPVLGTSANVYGVLDATTTAVTANQACNLTVMTHRDNITNEASCGTGAYIGAYSTDNGLTWDTTHVVLFCNSDASAGTRYPNGVIFNPAGNTNPASAYDVMSGPFTNGSAWVQTVYGSATFGDANANGMYWSNDSAFVKPQNNGDLSFMSSSDDSTVHVMGEGFVTNGAQTIFYQWLGAVLTTGKFNSSADSFTWSQTVFYPHIVPSYSGFGNSLTRYDDSAAPLSVPGTAWSQDGKIGYVVIFANLDSTGYNYYTDQPIVYRTANSGQTWSMMPPYNFRNIPNLTSHLEATTDSASVKIPIWYTFETGATASQGAVNSYDLTVDYMGNLHILGAVVSSYYSNPDSSYTVHFYSNEDGYIYDVYNTSASGGWQARYIDSMYTLPLANAARNNVNTDWDSSSATNFIGFGNRLQASRTTDGKHIFCTWVDDQTGSFPNELAFPDVYGQGYDVATAKASGIHQFTGTTDNYFLSVSDIVLTSVNAGDTTYTVPCTIAYPDLIPNDGAEAVTYYYLGKVVYNDTLGSDAGVKGINAQNFSVGPNYPNPFNNTTQFNIGLTHGDLVAVDVFTLFGQKVYSIPTQQMAAGNHLMTINATGWNAGVYFYRVTVDGATKTQKMVIQ